MKKLLSATLALAIGATCIGTLAACNTNDNGNDAEKAKEAIKNVRSTYIDSPKRTDAGYELISQVKIKDGSAYDVTWTVNPAATCTIENFSSYVSVGQVNENKKVPVSITKAEVAIEYELKASVTVGSSTETVKFDREVSAKPASHDGTLENPFTVANVIDMCTGTGEGKVPAGDYYGGNANATLVYVKGYIVDLSRANVTNASRVNYLYIVDEYVDGKGSKDGDALCVYTCNYGDVLKSKDDLEEGAEITLAGYIMNYQPKTGDPYAEVTYWKESGGTEHGVTCVAYKKIELTDAQKAEKAANAVTLAATYTAGEYDLPATQGEATLTWKKSATDLVSLNGNQMTVYDPESATPVTLTVTATVNGVTADKEITFTVQPDNTPGTQKTPFTVAQAKAELNKLTSGKFYADANDNAIQVYVHGYVTVAGTKGNYGYNNVYISDTKGDTQANSVLVYSINWDDQYLIKDQVELEVGDEITVKGYLTNHSSGGKEIAQYGTGDAAIRPVLDFIKKVELTNLEKAQKELDKVATTLTPVKAIPAGNVVDLPVSTTDGIVLHWYSTHEKYTVAPGTTPEKLNVPELPKDENVTVNLSVTATCGTDTTPAKAVTITIKKDNGVITSATFDFTKIAKGSELNSDDALTLLQGACSEDVLESVTVTKVYQGNTTGGGQYEQSGGFIKLGTGSADGKLVLTFSQDVKKVTIKCTGWKTTDKISVNKPTADTTDMTTINEALGAGKELPFTLSTASKVVTIDTNQRALIFSIEVEFDV